MFVNVSADTISRGKGHSAVAGAAYRSGEKLHDQRYKKTHDYTRKQGIGTTEILAPEDVPEELKNRQTLWNTVEARAKRKDSRLAKSLVLHQPRGRSEQEHIEVTRAWVKENFTDKGFIADVSHHTDAQNPHTHVLVPYHQCGPDGFYGPMWSGTTEKIPEAERTKGGPITREKPNSHDTKRQLGEWQESFRQLWNEKLEASGSDHRFKSCKERGFTYQSKRGLLWHKARRDAEQWTKQSPAHNQYQLIGSGGYPKGGLEAARQDIAEKYFEVMWGREWAWEGYDKDKADRGFYR